MRARPSSVHRLLEDMRNGTLSRQRYSTRSLYSRCEPLVLTTLLACIALLSGMLLGGAAGRGPQDAAPPTRTRRRS